MTRTEPLLKKEHIQEMFKDSSRALSKNGSAEKALAQLGKADFPGRKTPGWEKTDISNIMRHKYSKPDYLETREEYIRNFIFYGTDADILVFTNGHFSEKQSMIKSADAFYVGSIKRAFIDMPEVVKRYFDSVPSENDHIFNLFNKAYAEDGYLIYLPDDTKMERPIHVMNFIDGNRPKPLVQYRNLIVAGKNTHADIINSYHSVLSDFSLTNAYTEAVLEENARVNFHLFQGEGYDAAQLNKTVVKQEKSSVFKSNTATMCGTVVRNDLQIDFSDEFCDAQLSGFYLPARRQITDNSVLIKHNYPNCTGMQFYRGIVEDHAKAVFTGKTFVAQDAQNTDSEQSNRNILLSPDARAYSRPQLEIYADDVACAHGSTIGQIDKEALFYLQTRGISKRNAQTLLLNAFIAEVIEKGEIESFKQYINYLLNKRLRGEDIASLCRVKPCPGC